MKAAKLPVGHREWGSHCKSASIRGLPLCEKRSIIKIKPHRLFRKADVKRRTCGEGCYYESEIPGEHRSTPWGVWLAFLTLAGVPQKTLCETQGRIS